jgi:hypothetical protein
METDPLLAPPQSTRSGSGRDEATVATLAHNACAPVEVVKSFYDEELAELQSKSKVKKFIEVIARRRVKERLRSSRSAFTHHRGAGFLAAPRVFVHGK